MFHIESLKKEEIPVVLNLILELARYEKMEDEVVATEALLEEWIFERKTCEVLLAKENEKTIGFMLFFHNFSTFLGRGGIYLEDFYIQPEHRKKGYGKALFKKLAQIALERNCGRMEWVCLDWNQPSIDFYKKLGAVGMDDWTTYRLTSSEIEKIANN